MYVVQNFVQNCIGWSFLRAQGSYRAAMENNDNSSELGYPICRQNHIDIQTVTYSPNRPYHSMLYKTIDMYSNTFWLLTGTTPNKQIADLLVAPLEIISCSTPTLAPFIFSPFFPIANQVSISLPAYQVTYCNSQPKMRVSSSRRLEASQKEHDASWWIRWAKVSGLSTFVVVEFWGIPLGLIDALEYVSYHPEKWIGGVHQAERSSGV